MFGKTSSKKAALCPDIQEDLDINMMSLPLIFSPESDHQPPTSLATSESHLEASAILNIHEIQISSAKP
jgi:hypothetical protein